jgi:hypothetical protein
MVMGDCGWLWVVVGGYGYKWVRCVVLVRVKLQGSRVSDFALGNLKSETKSEC